MKKEILVLDEDENFVETVRSIFDGRGHDSYTCPTGSEALEILRKTPPDLVVVGDTLCDMDSITFVSKLREIRNSTQVVLLPNAWPVAELYKTLTKNLRIAIISQRPIKPEILGPQIDALLANPSNRPTAQVDGSDSAHKACSPANSAGLLAKTLFNVSNSISKLKQHPSDLSLAGDARFHVESLNAASESLNFRTLHSEVQTLLSALEIYTMTDQPVKEKAWLIIDLALRNAQKEIDTIAQESSSL